jgi:DNA adenine methylase
VPKTPLRYPGGKSRAIKHIADFLPLEIDIYYEPFVGGGSMLLYVLEHYSPQKVVASDLNTNLIAFWQTLQQQPEQLVEQLKALKALPIEDYRQEFVRMRQVLTDGTSSSTTRGIYYYALNKTSFSGMSESGTFAPQAWRNNFTLSCIDRLPYISEQLQLVDFVACSYDKILPYASNEAFAYLDPPYDIVDEHGALYGRKGELHKGFAHEDLRDFLGSAVAKWLLSYNNAEHIRTWYQHCKQHIYQHTYSMRATKIKREKNQNKGEELLIWNYEE